MYVNTHIRFMAKGHKMSRCPCHFFYDVVDRISDKQSFFKFFPPLSHYPTAVSSFINGQSLLYCYKSPILDSRPINKETLPREGCCLLQGTLNGRAAQLKCEKEKKKFIIAIYYMMTMMILNATPVHSSESILL